MIQVIKLKDQGQVRKTSVRGSIKANTTMEWLVTMSINVMVAVNLDMVFISAEGNRQLVKMNRDSQERHILTIVRVQLNESNLII